MNSIPLVVDYLRTHSFAQLNEEYGIKASAKPGEYMFSLNYDQIESKACQIVNECRGLILATEGKPLQEGQITGSDPVGETYVMARPFDRFFNHGDVNAAPVNFDDPNTIFFEKLDGTLCILYFNPELDEWHVATRAVPMADKTITGWGDWTFRKLFEKALVDTLFNSGIIGKDVSPSVAFNVWTKNLNKNNTYCFELTTPLNRIVVHYPDYRVHLLGCRETATGKEFPIVSMFKSSGFHGVSVCPSHKLSNLKELLDFVGSKSPMEQEGIVVCDSAFNRVKVKSLAYLAYNRVRDSAANSPRAVMELILSEKIDDVMPVLEAHIQEKAKEMQEGLRNLIHSVDASYVECLTASKGTDSNERKAFALAVQARIPDAMGYCMERWQGKCKNFLDYIQSKKDNNTGRYPDSFLDRIINLSEKYATKNV